MKTTFLTLLFFTTIAYGQIVNIENMRLAPKKQGFSGSVDLSLNYTMNTVQFLQLGDRARLAYAKRKHYVLLLTDHTLVQSKNVDLVNLGFAHLRYNYTFKDSGLVILEVYEQAQFNKIQKINLRVLSGVGLRFHILDQINYQLNVGTGLMAEYEELIDFGLSRDILSNNYLSFDGQFNEHIGMNVITYFQPKLIDFGNYRIANETQVRFTINKHFTYRIIYALTHDSRNIPDVRKTNYVFKNALSFTF